MFPARRLDDPRDLMVVAALQAVGAGRSTVQLPTMTTSFRAELRAQLVAVAPRLVEEGVRPGTETAPRTTSEPRTVKAEKVAPARRPSRTRPMTVLVAGAAIVVLGLGGATWLARGALPGDALYGLKRTAEGVDVSFSGSNLDKGHQLLVDAQTRVQEATTLATRPQSMSLGAGLNAGGALSASTIKLIVSTLQAADTDTHKGVTLVGDDAITRGNDGGLKLVVQWAQGQRDRIDALVRQIPTENAARTQAETSAQEIRVGLQRAEDLQKDYTNKTCKRGRDAFGPTACLASTTNPTAPTQPSSKAPSSGPTGSTTSTGTPTSAPTSGSAPTSAPTSSAGATRSTTRTTKPGAGASGNVTSVGPVTVGSCGAQVNLPVASVSLGTCTPGR